MKVLITGARGFLGGHITNELVWGGHEVVSVDIKNDPLQQDCRKLANVERLLEEHSPDVVVHLAAKVGRLFGEDDIAETIADNAGMTAAVARAVGQFPGEIRLVYASTSEVYGDTGEVDGVGIDGSEDAYVYSYAAEADVLPDGPARSSSVRLLPHNVYGLSKRWGEEAARLYAPDGLVVLRFSMPYGPGLPWGRGRAALINFLHQAMEGDPIPVHKGAERSWCFVGDTARAVRVVIESGQSGAYNVGRDDNAVPMVQVARLACDLVGASRGLIEEIDAPARQTVVKRLATDRIRALGWEPEVELLDGMQIVLDWIRAEKDRLADPVLA